MILPPISLGIDPAAFRPSSVSHSYLNASSDFLTETVAGSCVTQKPRLFCRLHLSLAPSLKEIAMGVMASSVKVAHPTVLTVSIAISRFFIFFFRRGRVSRSEARTGRDFVRGERCRVAISMCEKNGPQIKYRKDFTSCFSDTGDSEFGPMIPDRLVFTDRFDTASSRTNGSACDRHRALDDADLIWQFWRLLWRQDDVSPGETEVGMLRGPSGGWTPIKLSH